MTVPPLARRVVARDRGARRAPAPRRVPRRQRRDASSRRGPVVWDVALWVVDGPVAVLRRRAPAHPATPAVPDRRGVRRLQPGVLELLPLHPDRAGVDARPRRRAPHLGRSSPRCWSSWRCGWPSIDARPASFVVIFLAFWTIAARACRATRVGRGSARATSRGGRPPSTSPSGDKPNVYWLMLDEHARSDELLGGHRLGQHWFGDDLARPRLQRLGVHRERLPADAPVVTSTLPWTTSGSRATTTATSTPLAAPIVNGANPVVATFEAQRLPLRRRPRRELRVGRLPRPGPGDRDRCIEPDLRARSRSASRTRTWCGRPRSARSTSR